jgi:predicted RNA binding protein YcfA (HicA-like mRNA interferase family)
MSAARTIPSNASNRSVIRQLELWGWEFDRNRGDLAVFIAPNGDSVQVMRGHLHQRNSLVQLALVYELTCGGDAAAFWARQERLVPEVAYRNDKPKKLVVVPEESQPAEPTEPVADDKRAAPLRGLAGLVLAYMQEKPSRVVNAPDAGKAIGATTVQAANALNYLVSCGHAVRVMRGTFRLSPTFRAESVVHHQHTGPVDMIARSTPATVENTPTNAPILPVHGPKTSDRPDPDSVTRSPNLGNVVGVALDPDDQGDDLDSLLELVLPVGYKFSPSHLRAMRRWQNETARLLGVLRGEG